MNVKKLSCPALAKWVVALIGKGRVYAPQAKGERFAYELLETSEDLRLDHDVTILPPKKYLFPPRDALLEFAGEGKYSAIDAGPMILFGVHPYDVAAIAQADKFYASDTCDTHYQARRKNATIIACDVQNPSPNVFAGCMGTATVREGFDVLLTLVGDIYLAEAATAAGEAVLALAGKLEDADPVSLGRREQVWADAVKMLQRHRLKCNVRDLPALLDESYESPVWEKKSELCYSCNSCINVCPSCFCFDIYDEVRWDLSAGKRMRVWDGCMMADFAVVAGGHNFRKRRSERYRHRFYRKGKYLFDRMGYVACVGCGRCVTACTTNIANPVEVYNALMELR